MSDRPRDESAPWSLRERLTRLDRTLTQLRTRALRFAELRFCPTPVGVERRGDPGHRNGFPYDERDHTGRDLRPAPP